MQPGAQSPWREVRRLSLPPAWASAAPAQFCVELRVGHRGSGDDGKTKTRVTVRAGELRLKSRGDITQQNAVSWSAWITDEEVERLLAQGVSANQWPTSANLWPTHSAFQS